MNFVALDLRLGAPSAEHVPVIRASFHSWIAQSFLHASSAAINSLSPSHTIYLRSEDIRGNPYLMYGLINRAVWDSVPDAIHCLIVDLTANPYTALRDVVLLHVAHALVAVALGRPVPITVLLLPSFPPDVSLLWTRLSSFPAADSIYLVGPEGTCFSANRRRLDTQPFSPAHYRTRYAALSGNALESLQLKLIRRLGHFFRATPGAPRCSQFYFDASLAPDELKQLLLEAVRVGIATGRVQHPSSIVVHAPMSPWLIDPAVLAASLLNAPLIDISVLDADASAAAIASAGPCPILLLDLVDSGATASAVIGRLSDLGLKIQKTVLTSMSTGRIPRVSHENCDFNIEYFLQVSLVTEDSNTCQQHRLDLASTPVGDGAYSPVRAYDMWTILRSVRWEEERDIPDASTGLGLVPNTSHLFQDYGDFLAYKIHGILSQMLLTGSLAVVCPQEQGADAVIARLRAYYDDRMVAVEVPRAALTACSILAPASQGDSEPLEARYCREPWYQQLVHLRGYRRGVVLMDEFNASGGTARAMRRLLGIMGVPAACYLCVINRNPAMQDVDGLPLRALYVLPSPRP